MDARAAPWIWAAVLAAQLLAWPRSTLGAQVIPPGREAQVLSLVERALRSRAEEAKYDIRIEHDVIRVQLESQESVVLIVHHHGPLAGELAPGVALECDGAACSAVQRSRWTGLARALALERDREAATLWTEVQPATGEAERTPPSSLPASAGIWRLVALAGLGWLVYYSVRCLAAISWRERRQELLLIGALCAVSAVVALGFTAHLPLHEHNSYLARSDCAWMLDCTRDPAGPGWVPGFFLAYGPLLRAFPYSVANLCRFTLLLSVGAALLARHSLVQTLLDAGWSARDARHAGLWALGLTCLNPVWIRVAVAGTPWPFVALCLFGAGVASRDAFARSGWMSLVPGVAGTCLLSLAVNSNLVMLTALPLFWLGPALLRSGPRWWLPTPWQVASMTLGLGLSLGSLILFREVITLGANPRTSPSLYHVFFDARFLPPTLGVLMLAGFLVALRKRTPLLAVLYLAVVTHPTLTNYAGAPLGQNYPVSLINAFLGETLAAPFAGLGAAWVVTRGASFGSGRLAVAVLLAALMVPAAFAREGWRLLTGSRVPERELAAISRLLPTLPPHAQLVVPSRIQPMAAGVPAQGDPLELHFPVGEYLTAEHQRGRRPPVPEHLDAMARADTPELDAPGTLIYVGVAQRSFFQTEIDAGVVPSDLRRAELEALYQRFKLVPVATFELTPEQHPAIPWRLGAGRVAKLELGFYWLEPSR
ncbi:MAG: hypothetical protein KC766_23645 [Myxococcales bacterium]|nr:hypothetical protein [Myxococcales bacterium]